MKRIITVVLLVTVALILTGCVSRTNTGKEDLKKYIQLIMPDGTIVEGEYMGGYRYDNGWGYYIIDGVTYWTNQLRLVIWERR